MKEIKAYHVALFILLVLVLLAPIVKFSPEGGWNIGGIPLKFLTEEKFYHPQEQEKADITDIISNIDTTMMDVADPLLTHQNGTNGDMGAPNGGDISENASTELQVSEEGEKSLHAFFKVLKSVSANKEKISFLHYGDSQIEGDRMTNYIRQKVQTQFGGNGPGLIPAINVYNTISFKQIHSENFGRFTCFGGDKIESKKYGAMAAVGRFTPEFSDSVNIDTLSTQTGWIEIEPSKSAYTRARSYNHVKLHYNDCVAPTMLRVYQDGGLIHEEELITDGEQHTQELSFAQTPGKLKYEFTGKISPNICGFSLEGDYGVQVSNVGMRGTSANVLGGIKYSTLKSMQNELNTKLVIMQFGGNSVHLHKDSADVDGSVRTFRRYIKYVQELNPDAMVVVIGPSDMSKFEDQIYETYPFLPYFVEELRKMTIKSGAGYWNLYAAMGGKNSMPSWVEQGLAGKDHVHFTNGGAKFASQMFYNALIAAYAKWDNANK